VTISIARRAGITGSALLLLQAGGLFAHAQGADMGKSGKPKKDDLVITPAGPVPKESVHRVGPNEEVRRQKDGTYVIVPRTDQKNNDK